MLVNAIAAHNDGVSIALQVQPKASRTELTPEANGRLKLRVAAPPVDGAANREVVVWLAKQLRIPRSDIQILSGERGRKKVILVRGITVADVRILLNLS